MARLDSISPTRAMTPASPLVAPVSPGRPRVRLDRFVLGALALLFASGTWLAIVPDRVAFATTQGVVIVHVLVGILSLPLLAPWGVRHFRRFRRVAAGGPRLGLRWALVAVTLLASATGIVALWVGQGTRLGNLHLRVAMLPALALALHLLLERRRALALLVTGMLASAAAISSTARWVIPSEAVWPRSPPLDGRLRALSGFDSAAWCGECHTQNYAEWSRSVHARSLALPVVREQFVDAIRRLGRGGPEGADTDIAQFGGNDPSGACVRCHLPVTYFGDDPRPALTAPAPTRDGITCSFCHTLRRAPISVGTSTRASYVMPKYQPAPESVRRYLGQGADSRFARSLGNLLIRWRPEMHRRDYHTPLMDRSEICQTCHGALPDTTYASWQDSTYAPSVTCQDCHMATRVTGRPVREPGAHVPWGDVRAQHRSHLFLGGNVRAMRQGQDDDGARREHDLAAHSLRIEIDAVDRAAARVTVRVTVANDGIGHLFPGMETVQRYAWVQLRVLDAQGATLVDSGPPDESSLASHPAVFFRAERDRHVLRDTTIPPRGSRTISLSVTVPAGEPSRAEALLYNSFDSDPIVRTVRAL